MGRKPVSVLKGEGKTREKQGGAIEGRRIAKKGRKKERPLERRKGRLKRVETEV